MFFSCFGGEIRLNIKWESFVSVNSEFVPPQTKEEEAPPPQAPQLPPVPYWRLVSTKISKITPEIKKSITINLASLTSNFQQLTANFCILKESKTTLVTIIVQVETLESRNNKKNGLETFVD